MIDLSAHQHIHFVGVGGIGMSALARYLQAQGFTVSGCDRSSGSTTEALQRSGVQTLVGHDAAHLTGTDLVVVTAAVTGDNPELRQAEDSGIPIVKRAELLAAIMNAGVGIAVAGTHGKTTTSALIAHILVEAGHDPTVLIGGISANLGSNARLGRGEIVVEADEYDASFRHLRPTVGVITNVEPEHLDYYGTVQAIERAFQEFALAVSGTLVFCADDPALARLVTGGLASTVSYGLTAGQWRAVDIMERGGTMRFEARRGSLALPVVTSLAGEYNAGNILAALVVADACGIPLERAVSAIGTFRGVGRRMEIVGERNDIVVIDDYAVHPTEVSVTLAAIRSRYHRPLRVVFQPHTYTRTRDFLGEFARSFGDADAVYVMEVYAARETDTLGISGQNLADAAAAHHQRVVFTPGSDDVLRAVKHDVQPGDIVVTMGAGDVYRLGPRILEGLAA